MSFVCLSLSLYIYKAGPHGVVADVLDKDIVVSEFELESLYYIHFRIWERHELSYSLSYELNSTINVLLQEWLWN